MELSLVVFLSLFGFASAANPVVQLPEFQVTGFEYSFQHNGSTFKTNAFYSIPYAQPPVDILRFEKPLPLPVNPTKKITAQVLPPGCVQQEDLGTRDPALPVFYPVSEDCLFVNVVAPSNPPPNCEKYPVIMWIHGGGFVYGMSRFYGMETLARHFNPQGIVVVGIQYRIGFLGFFSLDKSYANTGLYDQLAALKWINTHISSFGGDPNQVTVWGNSAGSVSTHSHTLSPLSNSLFRYAIQSSGSLYNLWSHPKHVREVSSNFSATLGCSHTNVDAAKACLKTKSIEEMWQADPMNNGTDIIHWTPLMDEAFFSGKSIEQLTEESPIKNVLYGTTFAEGLVMTLTTDNVIGNVFTQSLGRTVATQASYTKTDFIDYIPKHLNTEEYSGNNRAQIQNLFDKYYLEDTVGNRSDAKLWYKQLTLSQTDGTIQTAIIREIQDKIAIGGKKLFMYLFDYVTPAHVPLIGLTAKDTPHAYEYQYLTDGQPYFPFNNSNSNSVEVAFTKKLVNGMAAFVKNGNPSTDSLDWPVITTHKKIKYMQVGETVATGNTYFNNKSALWTKVYDLGYGSNILI